MGKRHHNKPSTALVTTSRAAAPGPQNNAFGWGSQGYLLTSGYDGANTTPRRGYIYWPQTNTKFEASPFTRYEIRRRVHWLYGNVGIARRLVNGYARLIGFLMPIPDTLDDDWNHNTWEHFQERAGSPGWWDRSGKFDWAEGQIQMERTAAKDGFCLPVMTNGPSNGLQLNFYEAHQVVSPASDDGWYDGAQLDAQHRHLAYGVRNGNMDDDISIIAAADALYYGRFESWGETHPLSILAGAVNDLIDIIEIRSDIKHAIKTVSRQGMVLEQDAAAPAGKPFGGMGGPQYVATEKLPDGTTQQVTWEMVTNGGQVPSLDPGRKLKVVQNDNPGPNNREFEKDLVRSCANNIDVPYEALFEITGITGPGVRYWMADIRRWVLIKHLARARWCQRAYSVFVAKEIQAGRLAMPKGDKRFWRATYIGMADPTIDEARQGQLSIIELQSGLTTWADEWGMAGAFWKPKIRQRVREVAFAKMECLKATQDLEKQGIQGLTVSYEEVFAPKTITEAILPPGQKPPEPPPAPAKKP